jgi:hypothetical protein
LLNLSYHVVSRAILLEDMAIRYTILIYIMNACIQGDSQLVAFPGSMGSSGLPCLALDEVEMVSSKWRESDSLNVRMHVR